MKYSRMTIMVNKQKLDCPFQYLPTHPIDFYHPSPGLFAWPIPGSLEFPWYTTCLGYVCKPV